MKPTDFLITVAKKSFEKVIDMEEFIVHTEQQ